VGNINVRWGSGGKNFGLTDIEITRWIRHGPIIWSEAYLLRTPRELDLREFQLQLYSLPYIKARQLVFSPCSSSDVRISSRFRLRLPRPRRPLTTYGARLLRALQKEWVPPRGRRPAAGPSATAAATCAARRAWARADACVRGTAATRSASSAWA